MLFFHDVQYTNGIDAPAGRYCPSGGGSGGSLPCPAGSYCIGGTADASPCQVGTFSASGAGDTGSCTPCTARPGFFCALGSAAPDGARCPAGSFCLGNSSGAVTCPGGSYSASGTGTTAICTACVSSYCPPGSTSGTQTFPLVQFVRVVFGRSRPAGNILDMSELLAYDELWNNLAVGRAARAACTFPSSADNFSAAVAVDGTGLVAQDVHAIFESCNDSTAWWEVDIGGGARVA